MRKMLMAVIASAAFGTAGLMAAPASAQTQAAPVSELVAALNKGELQTSYSQYVQRRYVRPGPRVVERRYYRPGPRYYGRPYANDRRYYRRDRGSAAAAGAIGLATGAIIGGALAQQQQQAPVYAAPNRSAVAYCSQRFKSYDPASGTYLGYDGRRHACP
ncbi:BA14K family protein [Microvirga lenta]|uniref:BA14K family protein n=1 Tax=Microvirga lenta TaxID=2881337 RepID=UPI001CFFE8E4|nr:BA14K family protein [Microvirga lenta]MCB5174763.1 BA14K family protein [Microvirga lenta]